MVYIPSNPGETNKGVTKKNVNFVEHSLARSIAFKLSGKILVKDQEICAKEACVGGNPGNSSLSHIIHANDHT